LLLCQIRAKNAILYNVVDSSEDGLQPEDGGVRADVFMPGKGKLTLNSR